MKTNLRSILCLIFVILITNASFSKDVIDENQSLGEQDAKLVRNLITKYLTCINSKDVNELSKLYCSQDAFEKFRLSESNIGEIIPPGAGKYSHIHARKQFIDDLIDFWKDDNGYALPLNLELVSFRAVGSKFGAAIPALQIEVKFGSNWSEGKAYIITGEVIKDGNDWRFAGRCREIYARYPLSSNSVLK